MTDPLARMKSMAPWNAIKGVLDVLSMYSSGVTRAILESELLTRAKQGTATEDVLVVDVVGEANVTVDIPGWTLKPRNKEKSTFVLALTPKFVPWRSVCKAMMMKKSRRGSSLVLLMDDVLEVKRAVPQEIASLKIVVQDTFVPERLFCADVVAVLMAQRSILISDGEDTVGVLVSNVSLLSLLCVGDSLVLVNFMCTGRMLQYDEELSVIVRLKQQERRGGDTPLSPVKSPRLRDVPRNVRGERDFRMTERMLTCSDLRTGHVNVSLFVSLDRLERCCAEDYWRFVLHVSDNESSREIRASGDLAPVLETLKGGELLFLRNVCAQRVLSEKSKRRTVFALDGVMQESSVIVVSCLTGFLKSPTVCALKSTAWLSSQKQMRFATVAGQLTDVFGTLGSAKEYLVACHDACESFVTFHAEKCGIVCDACEQVVPPQVLGRMYTVGATLDGVLRIDLRPSVANALLGMTAVAFDRLTPVERDAVCSTLCDQEVSVVLVKVGETWRADALVLS